MWIEAFALWLLGREPVDALSHALSHSNFLSKICLCGTQRRDIVALNNLQFRIDAVMCYAAIHRGCGQYDPLLVCIFFLQ